VKIAVIGTGIAGNVAACRLAKDHEITVFEADSRIGGHTHTVEGEHEGQVYPVDTGFIVFNNRTYPHFIALLDELGVAWQDSDMSFSVKDERTGLEYNGTTLNALFAQRSNLLRPRFYRMIRDILRFNREAPQLLEDDANEISLQDYLSSNRYSDGFVNQYIMPMGAAIWSARPEVMGRMPARFFVRFFENHGLLTVNDRPVWRVIRGGSRSYLDPLLAGHRDCIRTSSPVESVQRFPDHVCVKVRGQEAERFDHVFIAAHSDQALAMLADPSALEREVLGAIEYQKNEAVLHTDSSLLPKRRLAWAAWNYHILRHEQDRVAVTYHMNTLQRIQAPVEFCVTLNNTSAIDPDKVIRSIEYDHPIFTPAAVEAQSRHAEVNGAPVNGSGRTWFCGAYWRNGFHEDGVVSALNALEHFDSKNHHAQRDLRRTG
jgi:predicted NAD/FAD-binding protein